MGKSLIITYHNIDIPKPNIKLPGLYVTPTSFKLQMFLLKKLNADVLSINKLLNPPTKHNKKCIAITFDDAYNDFYDNAFYLMEKYNYRPHLFVVSDLVGSYNKWDYDRLNVKKTLLDWGKIKELSDNGVIIDSHTMTHPSLTNITLDKAKAEITDSKKKIEDFIGRTVDGFCYPYGDYNENVKGIVMDAGYKYAVTTKKGKIYGKPDPFSLNRISIKKNTNIFKFIYKLTV